MRGAWNEEDVHWLRPRKWANNAFNAIANLCWNRGPYVTDVEGREYVDLVASWGPAILGHAHPDVVRAITHAAARGSSYGAPTAQETELAELVASFVPSIEMIRFVSSGTEAVMGALRVARGFTGRDLIVKLEGCYHGGADYLLVKAGSGLATFGVPTSAGVPAAIASTTRVLPYNDVAAVEEPGGTSFLDALYIGTSAITWATTVRCPCPCGVDET